MLSKKHIRAPKSFDPGRGYPREHLAYLSKPEMEMLRVMTDGEISRGPKGLPSFAMFAGTSGSGYSSAANSKPSASSPAAKSSPAGSGGNHGGGTSSSSTSRSGASGMASGGASKSAPSSPAASKAPSSSGGGSGAPRSGAAGMAAAKTSSSTPKAPSSPVSAGVGQSRSGAAGMAAPKAAMAPAAPSMPAVNRGPAASLAASKASSQEKAKTASALTAPNGSYYGPKGGTALNRDARLSAARSVGFSQPAIQRTPGDAAMLGRMMMAESKIIKNEAGLPRIAGLQGVADVVRNRMISDSFPDTVPGVLGQRKQFSPMADGSFKRTKENETAIRVAEAVLSGEQPPVVGNALNYANLHTVNTLPGYSSSATRRAFNSMEPTATISDARNPVTMSHTFGTIGKNDVDFAGIPAYSPGPPAPPRPAGGFQTAADTKKASGPVPRPVPRPWQDSPKPVPRPLQSFVGGDPRASLPRGSFPANIPRPTARPERSAEGMSFTPGLPSAMPPKPTARPERSVAGMSFTPGLPSAMPPRPTPRPERSVAGMSFNPGLPQGEMMQSLVAGDPRVGMPPGGFPAARGETTVPNDPRVGLPNGQFPAAAAMQSQVMGDPRVGLPPGSFPAAPPRAPALGGIGSPGLPPGYAERYGIGQPAPAPETIDAAAPAAPATGGWLKAATDAVNTGVETVKQKKAEVDQQIKEAEKKYGKLTPGKIKLAMWFNGLMNGGGTPSGPGSKFPTANGNQGQLKDPQVRAMVAQVLAAQEQQAPQAPPPVDWSYFMNTKSREQVMRELLGEEWNA